MPVTWVVLELGRGIILKTACNVQASVMPFAEADQNISKYFRFISTEAKSDKFLIQNIIDIQKNQGWWLNSGRLSGTYLFAFLCG